MNRLLGISLLVIALGCATAATEAPEANPAPENNQPPVIQPTPGLGELGGSRGETAVAEQVRSIYFEYDKDTLREDARATLRHNAQVLQEHAGLRVEIQGNCDERGSEEYNLALGMRRAEMARRYLIDLGVAASHLTVMSFGEENPAVRGSNEIAWAKNRRDDFKVAQ